MKKTNTLKSSTNSRGAAIFKKMLADKKAITEHFQGGGKISDLKQQFNFVNPLSIKNKR
jgi:hypothetical protein